MQHDVIVIGGSFAGLAAATYLARARRDAAVIDADEPRNRFAAVSHGFLGHDGSAPHTILATARAQLAAYPSASLTQGRVAEARRNGDGFAVTLADGSERTAHKLILAFGIRDRLPSIDGLAERWGHSVIHCPYCHGYEFADRPLGILYSSPLSFHHAPLIAEWGPVTLFLNGAPMPDAEGAAELAAHRIALEPAPVAALAGPGKSLSHVALADGRQIAIEALYVAPEMEFGSPLAHQLGCALEQTPMGQVIRTDAMKLTSVPGVYAAGDVARMPHSVSWAVADGVTAGTAAHRALVFG